MATENGYASNSAEQEALDSCVTILFDINDESGALNNILAVLSKHGISLKYAIKSENKTYS